MGHYSDAEWVPTCTTSLSQITYGMDDSYLTPQLSYTDAASVNATPVLSRPQSSSGFYPQSVEHISNMSKTRSSSSTGGYHHQFSDFDFTSNPLGSNALGIRPDTGDDHLFSTPPPLGSTSASSYYGGMGVADVNAGHLKRTPVPIAPNPSGLRKMGFHKRSREDDLPLDAAPKRRRQSSSGCGNIELNDEERLLLRLKDEENLMWKDIALRFQLELGKNHQVPALQMRYKRLREKLRVWTDTDVHALEQARDYWEKYKWDIIATKMLDFGCGEKWPVKYCVRKWEELHPGVDVPKDQPVSIRGSEAGSERNTPDLSTPLMSTPRLR
ncbi:MAG: hypothetical protein M1833_002180 [Piccolia ochrophora]|nr:MAG: hypothetical protein M1833_002180 [Piccolia ochrophora]